MRAPDLNGTRRQHRGETIAHVRSTTSSSVPEDACPHDLRVETVVISSTTARMSVNLIAPSDGVRRLGEGSRFLQVGSFPCGRPRASSPPRLDPITRAGRSRRPRAPSPLTRRLARRPQSLAAAPRRSGAALPWPAMTWVSNGDERRFGLSHGVGSEGGSRLSVRVVLTTRAPSLGARSFAPARLRHHDRRRLAHSRLARLRLRVIARSRDDARARSRGRRRDRV